MNAKQKNLIERIVAILIVLILNFVQYLFVGIGLVSYALELTNTNNENIEFYAYFLDANGEKQEKIEENIDAENAKIMIDISVKNEGYFNGKITVTDNNFTFKKENENEYIKEISDNEIILNQINAERKVTLEVGIIPKEEFIRIDTKTKVNIEGEYINSQNIEKNTSTEIKGTSNLEIYWKSSENTKAQLDTNLLTNAIYEINGEQKRIVQLLVNSRINDNSYPVKSTEIKIDVLENTEDVKVYARSTKATNDNIEFDESNYWYDNENQILTINIANEDENNISWNKNVYDTFVVTYVLNKDEDIKNKSITIASQIKTYDDKEVTANQQLIIENELDKIVSYSLTSKENYIYKGKIYTGEEKTYTINTEVNINYLDIVDEIKLIQEEAKFIQNKEEINSNITYKNIKINKQEVQNIFGEEGYITVENQDGAIIANINKDSETDEKGIIIINCPINTKSIKIVTSKPINLGTFNIENEKAISNEQLTREEITNLDGIVEKINTYESITESTETANIELKNTESKATFNVSTDKLSNTEKNENVKITVVLENNGEDKDLYQNPNIKIVFPKQITEIEGKYKLLYGNDLKIKEGKIYTEDDHQVLEINLEGEQNTYNTDVIEGTTLIIYTTISVDELALNSSEEIVLNYTNEKATSYKDNGQEKTNIEIISNNTKVTTASSQDYTIDTILKAYVGGEEINDGDTVKAGEIIEYELAIKNTCDKDISNWSVKVLIPEQMKSIKINPAYVEFLKESQYGEITENIDYYLESDEKEIDFKNICIEANGNITYKFMVRVESEVNQDTETNTTIIIRNSDNTEVMDVSMKSLLQKATLIVNVKQTGRNMELPLNVGEYNKYAIVITNNSEVEQKNIEVKINKNDKIEISNIKLELNEEQKNEDNTVFYIDSINPNTSVSVVIVARAFEVDEQFQLSARVKGVDGNIYRSNNIKEDIKGPKLDVKIEASTSSEKEERYVGEGDSIIYKITIKNIGNMNAEELTISDKISQYLDIESVELNGKKYEYNLETESDGSGEDDDTESEETNNILEVDTSLAIDESAELIVKTRVADELPRTEELKIINKAEFYTPIMLAETNLVVYYFDAFDLYTKDQLPSDDEQPDDEQNDQESEKYSISGVAWLDENKNGQRDFKEKKLGNIKVMLVDMDSKTILSDTTTSNDGEYSFNGLKEGKYVVIFEYNTEKYILTIYQADGIQEDLNSDVEKVNVNINGISKQMASTNILEINNRSIKNIDIGLLETKKFNLELSKTISKINITNSAESRTITYNDTSLAKVEIKAKRLNGSKITIEYKIKVTNNGEVSGYATQIVDYKPTDLDFDANINKGWSQIGDDLYNTSLENTIINPKETKELTLILTKTMTESNTGLINNIAKITAVHNSLGLPNMNFTNSTEKDIMQSANLIISVSTGKAIIYVSFTLFMISIMGMGIYLIKKKVL